MSQLDPDQLANLYELAAALKELHQALLDQQRLEYEIVQGPIAGGAHLLHLAAQDPSFAWLRTLSTLMVDLDGLLEAAESPSIEEVGALRQELEEMFSAQCRGPFWQQCSPLLQMPRVAMGYGRVRLVLSRLPQAAPSDVAAQLHATHRWAVSRRMRGAL